MKNRIRNYENSIEVAKARLPKVVDKREKEKLQFTIWMLERELREIKEREM